MDEGYGEIRRRVDEEFERNRRLYGARIRCGPGCSDCCSQLFQITEIEAVEISRGVRTLPPEDRRRLRDRARPYLEQRRKLVTATGEPEAWGNLPPEGTRLPCPALVDGVCSIYEFRPLMCRKFGVPIYNPQKPGQAFACELNFKDGDPIDDPHLVQIQTGIYNDWKQVQADYSEAGGYRDEEPITVARALIEDFSETDAPGG